MMAFQWPSVAISHARLHTTKSLRALDETQLIGQSQLPAIRTHIRKFRRKTGCLFASTCHTHLAVCSVLSKEYLIKNIKNNFGSDGNRTRSIERGLDSQPNALPMSYWPDITQRTKWHVYYFCALQCTQGEHFDTNTRLFSAMGFLSVTPKYHLVL